MTEMLSAARYATVVYLTGMRARSVVLQAAASLPRGRPVEGRGPGPARHRVQPGALR